MPGVAVKTARVTEGGALYNDRRWALEDKQGRLINGKNSKRIFLLQPSFDLASETVFFPEGERGKQFDLADTVGLSNYFSVALSKAVFLKEDQRQGFPDDMNASGPTLISQASLETVSSWFPRLSIDDIRARFRINLEISSEPEFWEDRLFVNNEKPREVQIGDVKLDSSNPCARCSVPTKGPSSGRTYSDFYEIFIKHREQSKPVWLDVKCFDHWYYLSANTNITAEEAGKLISVGDSAHIL